MRMDRAEKIGTGASAALHVAVIVWAIVGTSLFPPKPTEPVEIKPAGMISEAEFAALQAAAPKPGTAPPSPPETPAPTPADPPPETVPETVPTPEPVPTPPAEPPAEPPEFASRCAECGGEFHQAPRHGRPLRFCSAECRKASKNRQKREWAAAERAPTSALTCRRCGLAFQPPPRSAGRAPHWCSPRCKLASLRKPADPPKIPDLFSPAERKSE